MTIEEVIKGIFIQTPIYGGLIYSLFLQKQTIDILNKRIADLEAQIATLFQQLVARKDAQPDVTKVEKK